MIIFARDITRQQELQDKLHKAEKMEAIGFMAGGVAHDLNILSGIISYPDLILVNLPEDSAVRPMVEGIRDSGRRAADVVADLLTVARGVAAPHEIDNLNRIIRDYLDSPEFEGLQNHHPGICFITRLEDNLANLSCSSVHIRKCLMNLVTNAAEAIGETGTVEIATANRDRAVLLRVNSDEHGMVFELLFPASGEAVNEPGGGTDLARLRGNGKRILVVDDEEQQRDITTRMLKTLGYRGHGSLLGRGGPGVALQQSDRSHTAGHDHAHRHGRLHPYERILADHPGQKAIIVSGYADDDAVCRARQLGAGEFIKKPCSMAQLGEAVSAVLH